MMNCKLPLNEESKAFAYKLELDPTACALSGGEDYELLFTIAIEDFDKIKANPNFTVIGHLTQESEGCHLITRANTKIELKARGWNSLEE